MMKETLKAALTPAQRNAGLYLHEPDDHTVLLKNSKGTLAIFGTHATIKNIRLTAEKFLI